jgi:pimeloyl-ACP methyl ester carboxylesterase
MAGTAVLHCYKQLKCDLQTTHVAELMLPNICCIHPVPGCLHTCRHQMTAFAKDYDVVALDMRGYNTSDKPKVGPLADTSVEHCQLSTHSMPRAVRRNVLS